MPGPRAPTSRPRRKTTARSYSWTILTPLSSSTATMTTKMSNGWIMPDSPPCDAIGGDAEREAVDSGDAHDGSPAIDRPIRGRLPDLAVHEDGAARRDRERTSPSSPSMPSAPVEDAAPLRADDQRAEREHDRGRSSSRGADHVAIDRQPRALVVEQQQRAEHEGDQPADAEHAEAGQEQLGDQHRDAEHEQREARGS